MKLKKLDTRGITHIFIPLLAILAIACVGTYLLVASHADNTHSTASSTRFTGTITADECATSTLPIGDVGCYLKVNNKTVYVEHGNGPTQVWGSLFGFTNLSTNYTGRTVSVYAAVNGNNSYTLQGSTSYYAKLSPIRTARFTGTITADECATSTLPIGDVGCYLKVNNKTVYVEHGNGPTQVWGSLFGFTNLSTNYTGRTVSVYAAVNGNNSYTLQGSTSYYVSMPVVDPPL